MWKRLISSIKQKITSVLNRNKKRVVIEDAILLDTLYLKALLVWVYGYTKERAIEMVDKSQNGMEIIDEFTYDGGVAITKSYQKRNGKWYFVMKKEGM